MRPTATGVVVLLTAIGLFALGWWTTDNLIVLTGLMLGSPMLADAVMGRRALSAVSVERRLPAEVFAEVPAVGSVRVHGVTGPVTVCEADGSGQADVLGNGATAMTWEFSRRGGVQLARLALVSRWPLGLVVHHREVVQPVELWVAPRPIASDAPPIAAPVDVENAASRSRTGDFHGLRAYTESDEARAIHWRTSARRNELVVVERAGEGGEVVVVTPIDCAGDAWERELERATGAVLHAVRRGPVLLRLPGGRVGPGRDGRFRQAALRALACAEVR